MPYVKGKSQIKKVKGAKESSAPSDVKMSHLKMKSYIQMNKYDKDMMDYRKQIAGDKEQIHKIDIAKKHHDHVVSRIAGRKSRM